MTYQGLNSCTGLVSTIISCKIISNNVVTGLLKLEVSKKVCNFRAEIYHLANGGVLFYFKDKQEQDLERKLFAGRSIIYYPN